MIPTHHFRCARIELVLLLLAATMCGGCNWFKGLALFLPEPQQTVPAEFAHLEGSVAIVVWVHPETLYDYPNVRLELASHVADQLAASVRAKLSFADVMEVEQYIDSRGGRVVDPAQIGRQFGTHFVLYMEILEFTLRDPFVPDLLQAKIRASVTVYDMEDKDFAPRAYDLAPVTTLVPDRPAQFTQSNAMLIRKVAYETFAGLVARKFHKYKEAVK